MSIQKKSTKKQPNPDQTFLELLQIAINNTTDGIALLDSDSKYTYLNRAHIEQFGYSDASELLGKTWHIFYNKEEVRRAEREIFPKLMEDGSWRGETIGVCKQGTPIYQEITLTALADGGLICVTRILSELKTIEKKLTASNLNIASIVNNVTAGILLEDANRTIIESNKELGVLIDLELDPEMLRGTNCLDGLGIVKLQMKDPDGFIVCVEELVSNKIPVFNEVIELKDGSFLERDFIPIHSNRETQGFLWIYRDVTEQERTKNSLISLVSKEKELNEMRSKLVRTVSHEFKKPILNTLSSIQLLQGQLENSGKEIYSNALNHIIGELKELNESVTKLVRYEALSDRDDTARRPVRSRNLIANYLHYHFKLFMLSEKFEIQDSSEIEEINIDLDLLNLALKNVVENALKYSNHNDKIQIKTEVKNNHIYMSFANPVSAQNKPDPKQLGTPLYRANPGDDKGLGLGLGIVEHATGLIGGSVNYEVSKSSFLIQLIFPVLENKE